MKELKIFLSEFILFRLYVSVFATKRVFPLFIHKGVSLNSPYASYSIGTFNLVKCGILCKIDTNCFASSLSHTGYDCSLYDVTSAGEIINSDTFLIYQNTVSATTDSPTTTDLPPTTELTPVAVTTTQVSFLVPPTWAEMEHQFTLMKPQVGCPGGDVAWSVGQRFHDTEDDLRSNGYVVSTNMAATQDTHNNVIVNFCTKTSIATNQKPWPAGNYCILKQSSTCPSGFQEGFVFFDDENNANANSASGTLPNGIFNTDTKVFYCCRSDGSDATQILLPTGNPFYLLRHTGNCQQVSSMSVLEETIRWYIQTGGIKNFGVVSPYEDGPSDYLQLHFCYYS